MPFVRVVSCFSLLPVLASRIEALLTISTDTETTFISSLQGQPEVKASVEKQHPFRGLGRAEDIAKAAVFLTSEENSWITGIGLPVDGGFTSM